MANPSLSKSLYAVLFIVFLLSVQEIMVEAKECNEVLPWVTTECKGGEPADAQCLHECQYRHGLSVKISCKKDVACLCTWSCANA